MRRREPRREEIGILVSDFCIGSELPSAVVDVVEIIEDLGLGPARLRDRGAGRHAAAHWTRVDPARLPRRRDASRESICLGATAVSQLQWLATAKPLGVDACDVPVPDQEEFGHGLRPAPWLLMPWYVDRPAARR